MEEIKYEELLENLRLKHTVKLRQLRSEIKDLIDQLKEWELTFEDYCVDSSFTPASAKAGVRAKIQAYKKEIEELQKEANRGK